MNVQNKKVTEGISGIYPQMTLWQEFGSAVATALFILLPAVFYKLRMELSKVDLIRYISAVLTAVKKDRSNEPLKNKIARAVQALMDNKNVNSAEPVNYEQMVLNLLPNNLETKSEEEVTEYISNGRKRLGLPPVRNVKL